MTGPVLLSFAVFKLRKNCLSEIGKWDEAEQPEKHKQISNKIAFLTNMRMYEASHIDVIGNL